MRIVTDYPDCPQVHGGDEGAEDPDLVGGLVGVRAAEPLGAVGGDGDEGDAGVHGLEHGGMEVGDRRAARADDGRGRADLGQPEGQEAGRPLVEARVQPDQPGLGGVVRRERQRRVARSRCQHDLADPALEETADDRTAELGGRRHGWPPFRTARTAASRSSHHATRSGGGRAGVHQGRHDRGYDDLQRPVHGHEVGRGHVGGQQRPRGEPAGVLEGRERGRQGDSRGQAERRLERGGDDDGHARCPRRSAGRRGRRRAAAP